MSLGSSIVTLLKVGAMFDPALAPIAAVAGGIDDVIEGGTPLLAEVKKLLDAHGGDHDAAALKLRTFNALSQDEQNAIMDRSSIAGQ